MSEDRFIGRAIKHPGSLRRWAKMHGFENADGTIDLRRARAYARRNRLDHRLKQIQLAATLKKLRR